MEVEDHLQKLNDNLLSLEKKIKDPSATGSSLEELLNELMRSAHTIKSSSATMGYGKLSSLTHTLEDIFDQARNGSFKIKESILGELFKVVDAMEDSIRNIKENDAELDVDSYSDSLKRMIGTNEKKSISKISKNEVPEKKTILPISEAGDHVVEKIQHVNVPVKKLDDLLNITEELLNEKMRLNSLYENILKNNSTLNLGEVFGDFKPALEHFGILISNLQYIVMQSRLVPAGQIFARFPRMIRDLSVKTGKEVELLIKGEDLEMDRGIIDKLGEPLVHLLRNAVDHGVEKKGKIILEAKRDKDFVSIIVEDDGGGIKWQKLVTSAGSRGIITNDHQQELLNLIKNNPQNIWQPVIERELLYNPNLSTREEITETSGRGVGTSVVKQFIDDIGGDIVVISPVENNIGTKFILNLPLTLAIIKALLVEINGEIFAVPFSSILRAVSVNDINIKSVADQDVAVIDDIDVPLISLEKVFTSSVIKNKKELVSDKNKKQDKKIVVLVQKGSDTVGFLVHKLVSEQEIIVKSLPTVLSGIRGFSGSTILGNGEAVLILDVFGFLQGDRKFTRI